MSESGVGFVCSCDYPQPMSSTASAVRTAGLGDLGRYNAMVLREHAAASPLHISALNTVAASVSRATYSGPELRQSLAVKLTDSRLLIVEPSPTSRALLRHVNDALAESCTYLTGDDIAPTDAARRVAVAHLWSVASGWPLPQALPFPDVTTVGDGEISCEWERGERCFFLVVYPDGSSFSLRGRMVEGAMVDRQPLSAPEPGDTIAALKWLVLGSE